MGSSASQPTATAQMTPAMGTAIGGPRTFSAPAPTPAPATATSPAPTPMVKPTGPNAFQQAQGYQTRAGDVYTRLSEFTPEAMQAVGVAGAPIEAGQLADVDYGQYMSPYTQQVIERGQADIDRQRQIATQGMAAKAASAGAFGGSRHGVAEGTLAGEYGRMGMDFAAQQRQQAFDQAQRAAQYDIGQRYAADIANRQAEEAAAAREQAARAANYGGQFQAAQIQMGAAGGLGGLGQQLFGQGMDVQQQIQGQGQFQRMLQQQMMDRARQQYMGATGAPLAGLGTLSSILGGTPYGTTTTTSQPFNPASLMYLL